MKAPKYAYIMDGDGDFFKAVMQRGSKKFSAFVARYFKGSEEEGGYAVTSERIKSGVKSIFHIDSISDKAVKDKDGSVSVIGFLGWVDVNGQNAKYHNMDKRDSGYRFVRGTKTLALLNDAGLNTRPYITIAFSSSYANYIIGNMTVRAGFYVPATGGAWQKGTFNPQTGTVPRLKAREGWSTMISETSSTPVNAQTGLVEQYSGPVTGGKTGQYRISSDSEEGQSIESYALTTKERIIVPRPTFNYSSSEPSSLDDMGHSARDVDMFETDALIMHNVQEGGSATPTETPPMFNGGGDPNLVTSNLVPTGWYYSPLFSSRTSEKVKVFYVENGYTQYYKLVQRISGTWGVELTVTFESYGASGAGWPDSPGGSWRYRARVIMSYAAASGSPQSAPPTVSLSNFILRTARSQGGAGEQILQFSASSIADTLTISDSKRSDQSEYIYANNDNNLNLTMYVAVQSYDVESNTGGLKIWSDVTSVPITGTSGGTDPDPTPGGGTDPGGTDPGGADTGGADTGA